MDNKRIEKFLETKLRNSESFAPSGSFNKTLMVRIIEENKMAMEEIKSNKLAKYIIGGFSSFVIALTVILGILSRGKTSVSTPNKFNIEPTIETSNSYFNQFLSAVQNVFSKAMEFLGLTSSSHTVEIVVGLLIALTLFMLADKFFVRGKLRSR